MTDEIINELLALDQAMLAELLKVNPKQQTEEEVTEMWEKTIWHKIIMDRIKELEKPKLIIT